MKPASIVLYVGTVISGLITLMCLTGYPHLSKMTTIIIWSIAFITLITGAFLDKFMKEDFCCNGNYSQIFNSPVNGLNTLDNINNKPFPHKHEVEDSYTRNQYARHGVRSNKISQQYRYSY